MATKYDCHACKKQVTATKNQRYRSHSDGDGEPCEMSSAEIPEHVLAQPVGVDDAPDVPREGVDFAVCPQCGRKVKLTRLGYFEPHDTTMKGGDRCEVSGVRAKNARRTETVALPGDEPLPPSAAVPEVKDSARPAANRGLALPAGSSASTETSSPESATTSKPSPEPAPAGTTSSDAPSSSSDDATAPEGPFQLAPNLDDKILQPFSHILQPTPAPLRVKLADAMSDDAKAAATRFREIFFSYSNRRSSDNRSAQKTMGPSEIGYECDRRLAMSLMGIERVNPGGDGWAAWIGTQGHRGLEEMFTWASANSGRFATEMRLEFPSKLVPKGTADILDRVLGELGDFKFMGEYSLKKLIQQGPPPHYRVQAHVYGLGATLAGEKIRRVAIYGLPRAGSSLDGMYVWTEKFDKKLAEAALDRVERISGEIDRLYGGAEHSQMDAAAEFSTADECRYCPFHLKGDKEMKRGCPGK
jgi:hypothetical protein